MLSAQAIGIGPDAIDEVKASLRIQNGDEDALAGGLIGSAASLCEQFTGRALLRREFKEVIGASSAWMRLEACPVQAIVGVDLLGPDGAAATLGPGEYAVDIDAAGEGWVRLTGAVRSGRVRVRYEAGLAASWAELPEALRHGIVRLAAHLYEQRDRPDEAGPPAAVTALWRPWRKLRLC
jgi:uncharacterized phiE125 gp8 family phage protein